MVQTNSQSRGRYLSRLYHINRYSVTDGQNGLSEPEFVELMNCLNSVNSYILLIQVQTDSPCQSSVNKHLLKIKIPKLPYICYNR